MLSISKTIKETKDIKRTKDKDNDDIKEDREYELW